MQKCGRDKDGLPNRTFHDCPSAGEEHETNSWDSHWTIRWTCWDTHSELEADCRTELGTSDGHKGRGKLWSHLPGSTGSLLHTARSLGHTCPPCGCATWPSVLDIPGLTLRLPHPGKSFGPRPTAALLISGSAEERDGFTHQLGLAEAVPERSRGGQCPAPLPVTSSYHPR